MFGKNYKKDSHKEDLDRVNASIKTNFGEMKVVLFAKECPETVWNFINLAEGRQETVKKGPFYNGLVFHRVINDFVIQGGCPLGKGHGGPGYQFEDECNEQLRHTGAGILSMANAGPGTNGSQFFITLGATPHLDGKHTVFGKVTDGMSVLMQIAQSETDGLDRPVDDVIIEEVVINREG